MFRAYEQRRDRLVAIKVFRLDLTPEQAASLVREFETLIARAIDHPAIAAPIAAGLEGSAAYLVQEYAIGDSLDVLLRERGSLAREEAIPIIASLAGAIDAAAAKGVSHGALHLRDVIVSSDSARMTGFGVAPALKNVGARLPTRSQYTAPEGPSDIYSLAAIAFETISGRRFSAANLDAIVEPGGEDLRGIFATILEGGPAARPASASQLAKQLQQAAGLKAIAAYQDTSITPSVSVAEPEPYAAPSVSSAEPEEPTFTGDELGRFTEIETPDFHIDPPISLEAPGEEPTPFPASWDAQPPRMFQTDEQPIGARRRWKPIMAIALGIFLLVVAAMFLGPWPISREGGGADPSVSETTVDLPPAGQPAPPAVEPTLPSPAPPVPVPPPAAAPSAPPSRATAAAARGRFLVRSTPAGADVWVNGEPRGKTPLAVRDLAVGSYTIRVARDGYADDARTVRLTAQRPTASVTFALRPDRAAQGRGGEPGGIVVQSRPAGASVFVNNRLVGSTPLAITDLPAGPAAVRIEKDGYRVWSSTVRVGAGENVRVNASLEPQSLKP